MQKYMLSLKAQNELAFFNNGLLSVSYTHLTLPTIA